MKKIFAVLTVLALSTAMVAAQDPQPTQTQTQTDVGQPTDTNEPVFKGCVSGTKDNYVLTTSDGQSFRLHSDKDINEHVGKMVEIRGTVKKEGVDRPDDAARMSEIDVADLKSVSGGNCPAADSSAAATSEPMKSDATDQASASTATDEASASTATEPAAVDANVTEQPASEPAATETTSQPAVSAEASTTSDPSASAAVSTEDSTASVQADQSGVDVDANRATDTEVASANVNQDAQADAAQLPETASPLPLLGLLGFAATGLGLVMRRK